MTEEPGSRVPKFEKLGVHIKYMGQPWWVVRTMTDGVTMSVIAGGPSAAWCDGWLARYMEDKPTGYCPDWLFRIVDGKATWEAAVEAAREQRGSVMATDYDGPSAA